MTLCAISPWKVNFSAQGSFEYQLYNSDSSGFAGIITEKSQYSQELIETAILTLAGRAMNKTVADVKVLKREMVTLNGKEWNHLEFPGTFKGTSFMVGNYYR